MLDLVGEPITSATADAVRARPRSSRVRSRCLLVVLSTCFAAGGVARADWRDDIGFTSLQRRLGPAMPTGKGVQGTQVEMAVDSRGDYLPDLGNPELRGKNISCRSGQSGISSHATVVGQYYFGAASSVGPGIDAVWTYEANDWSGRGCLNFNSPLEPEVQSRLVQNHSWIGSFGQPQYDTDALRRVDLLVERDGVVVATGVKNGAETRMPELVCSAYNVIAVGLTNGNSSHGPTRVDGSGRVKPDLVAPMSATSWATPVVASSASLLTEAVDAGGYLKYLPAEARPAARALLIKALLMGGATKDEWPDWRRGFAVPCTDGRVPLDYRYGAGELNIDNSHRILTAGRTAAGNLVPAAGWDLVQVPARGAVRYAFDVPESSVATSASILATWNRRITIAGGDPLRFTPTMANIDLRLYRARGAAVGELVDASLSMIDNVEHVYQRNLTSGRYVIELTSDRQWDCCLTWDVQLKSTAPVAVAKTVPQTVVALGEQAEEPGAIAPPVTPQPDARPELTAGAAARVIPNAPRMHPLP